MKKKKFGAIALAGILSLTGLSAIGCGADPTTPETPTHTHEYVGAMDYMVENGKAYTYKACDCGAKDKTEISNALIATPETAQTVLDGDINGKTIVFDGTFTNVLEIRPSAATATIYSDEFTTEYEGELDATTQYAYARTLENVTFAATAGSTFSNMFLMESGLIESKFGETGNKYNVLATRYDAVKGKNIVEGNAEPDGETTVSKYLSKISYENLTLTHFDFVGKDGRIYHMSENSDKADGLTIQNSTFITSEMPVIDPDYDDGQNAHWAAAIFVGSGFTEVDNVKNVVIKNCYIDSLPSEEVPYAGHQTGIYTRHLNNLTIENNIIKNTHHNPIAVQSHVSELNNATKSYSTGVIIIKNNVIENTFGEDEGEGRKGERAIRFGVVKDANLEDEIACSIVIEGNTFTNATDSGNEFMKFQKLENVTYSVEDIISKNTYDMEVYNNNNESYPIRITGQVVVAE